MGKKDELDELDELNPGAALSLKARPNIMGLAGRGKKYLKRLLIVGGDNRVLGFGWPEWYEVVHVDKSTPKQRLQLILGSGKIDYIFVLMRWRDERLIQLVRKFATCPVHYWPRGIGELVKEVGTLTAPKKEPEPEPAPRPEHKPQRQVWFEAPKPQPEPEHAPQPTPPAPEAPVALEAPAAPVIAEAPKEEAMPPKNTTPPKKEGVSEKQKQDIYAKLGALASADPRKTVWKRSELEMLVLSWQECDNDASRLVENFKTLGGKRTATALLFCLQRVCAVIGQPIHDNLLKGLRKLSEADRKKSTLGIVEMIEKDKGSNVLKREQEDEEELLEPEPLPVKTRSVGATAVAVAQQVSHDHKQLVSTLKYIALGVRMAGKSKEAAFDEMMALLEMVP